MIFGLIHDSDLHNSPISKHFKNSILTTFDGLGSIKMLWIVEDSLELFSDSLIWGYAREQVNERWSIETREKGWNLVSDFIFYLFITKAVKMISGLKISCICLIKWQKYWGTFCSNYDVQNKTKCTAFRSYVIDYFIRFFLWFGSSLTSFRTYISYTETM